MKAFNKIIIAVVLLLVAVFTVTNAFLLNMNSSYEGRPYRVEISRIIRKMEQYGAGSIDLSDYDYVTDIQPCDDDFYNSKSDYMICMVNDRLYRFDYKTASSQDNTYLIFIVNTALAVMSAAIIAVMLYLKFRMLLPFEKLKNVPYELSKGNLTSPVRQMKNRYFGRFLWGVDLLRENIEEQKQRELKLQKEKKTLLLSLSHDIKTPLSAIKLYSKALSKELYKTREKQLEIADSINTKADEIEGYVSQIITASREDFLSFDIDISEFYLSSLVAQISGYYCEKLSLVKTEFTVGNYSDCLIKGDFNRSIEVLQNIIENAVKYGDGKSIEIIFSEEDGCVLITVRNSGNTLEQSELTHIFESFWRGSNAENKNGSGLGLYICRQLMRKMNGEVFVRAEGDVISITSVFEKV